MRDRQVQYPSRFRLSPVSGQENVYDMTAVPGTITQAGTALNKANLLSDATAALLGLTGDPSVNDALAAVSDRAKVATGSYIGTGTYGEANPNSLTFPFAPKLVIVQAKSTQSAYGPLIIRDEATLTPCRYITPSAASSQSNTLTWAANGKSVEWYTSSTTSPANYQLNGANIEYIWIAIG